MFKSLVLCLLVAMVLSIDGALFEFQYDNDPERFVFELTDEAKIQEARNILAGKELKEIHAMGQLAGTPAPYNPGYPFILEPATIQFVEFGYPMCEGSIRTVSDCIMNSCSAHLIGKIDIPYL